MNQFGGHWTDQKMEIVVSYAKAYLSIMNGQTWAKTIYFDGFAGSGSIADETKQDISNGEGFLDLLGVERPEGEDVRKGTALRILDITYPKPFDMYYFVEKNEVHYTELKAQVKAHYADRAAHVVKGDCNDKLVHMAKFMTDHTDFRALAFIDPYGMSLKWSSIQALKDLGVDLWILVPTGLGVNRVLVNDGEIPEPWLCTLESFLGLDRDKIIKHFYKERIVQTLFDGEITMMTKEKDTVHKVGQLYSDKLKEVFKYVSQPFVMHNSTNSIMYHFMMATNNPTALKIANDVIKPKYKL